MPRRPNQTLDDLGLPLSLAPEQPKGDQLREILEALATRLGGGAALPSERAIAERYGVARMTVRSELRRLDADGVVAIRPGAGAFVCAQRRPPRAVGSSFSRDMRQRGLTPGAVVVEHNVLRVTPRLAESLEVEVGTRALRLVRIRTADGEPMGLERTTLSLERFPGLQEVDLEQHSLYDTLQERWSAEPRFVQATATAVLPTADEVELLGWSTAEPCLLVTSTQRDNRNTVIEVGRSIYRGDRYDVDLSYQVGTDNR
ncbi:MAG TPA: GntR family transcriptional regulator [Microlunatus sp.]